MMEPLRDLSVEYVPISSLRPNPRNARIHTARQVRQIGRSLEAFGFNVPVLIDATNNIVAMAGFWRPSSAVGTKCPRSASNI
jgi:ParB-like chromosome segregation protein Spo0J